MLMSFMRPCSLRTLPLVASQKPYACERKKELTKDQVEGKYNNPLVKWDEENGKYVVKFKIIIPPPVPELGKKYSKPTLGTA